MKNRNSGFKTPGEGLFVRPTVEVGKAGGWSGLGCYIQAVEIGPYGEKKGL